MIEDKMRYRYECDQPGCSYKTNAFSTESAADKAGATHYSSKHFKKQFINGEKDPEIRKRQKATLKSMKQTDRRYAREPGKGEDLGPGWRTRSKG
jgi:hypothetical protein